MVSVLIPRGHLDTDIHRGRPSCEEEGRLGVMLLQADPPEMASKHQELGQRQGAHSASRPTGETKPANTLISDFQPPFPVV